MLDTLKIADMLRDAGFNEQQARALADVQKQAVEEGGLATKTDIVRLEGRIDGLATQMKIMLGVLLVTLVPIFIKIFFG